MEEPRVIIYQTASEKEGQLIRESNAGLSDPQRNPFGGIGSVPYSGFQVRNFDIPGYSFFFTADNQGFQVQQV